MNLNKHRKNIIKRTVDLFVSYTIIFLIIMVFINLKIQNFFIGIGISALP